MPRGIGIAGGRPPKGDGVTKAFSRENAQGARFHFGISDAAHPTRGLSLTEQFQGFFDAQRLDKLLPNIFVVIANGGFAAHVIIVKGGICPLGNDNGEASFKRGFYRGDRP